MKIIKTMKEWSMIFSALHRSGLSIGLVPTMGALHAGHASLIQRSLEDNDVTAVSIFVNPTQFDNSSDLENYPATWEEDLKVLEQLGVEYLLYPAYEQMYPDDYRYRVTEDRESTELCGASRPGHFDGVLTVVMKLLLSSRADRAYFGEKDWQQYSLIAGMAEAFFVATQIIPCPLIRDESGLALSSRNKRLSDDGRKIAPELYRIISSNQSLNAKKKALQNAGFSIDYLVEKQGRIFAAVFLGDLRLIDNVKI